MESIFNKSFANPTGKPPSRSLSSIATQALIPAALLKRDPNTGAFPMKFQKLPNSEEHFFLFLTERPWWLSLRPNCFQVKSSPLEVVYKIDPLKFS